MFQREAPLQKPSSDPKKRKGRSTPFKTILRPKKKIRGEAHHLNPKEKKTPEKPDTTDDRRPFVDPRTTLRSNGEIHVLTKKR